MFIVEKPYASEFLIDSIVQNDWPVLENNAVKDADFEEGAFDMIPSEIAKNYYLTQEYPLIYSNSENAIAWVLENLPDSNLATYIKLFKDKSTFREILKETHPDFQFQTVEYANLKDFSFEGLKLPVVVKPAVGFLGFGVHKIKDPKDWKDVVTAIEKEMRIAQMEYPKTVVDSFKFVVEEYVDGEEFALDAYFDRNGEPVILNIYQRPLINNSELSGRIYLMSTGIMIKYMAKFALFLRDLAEAHDIRNFPAHIELKINSAGEIVPIEINPMRFARWCAVDVAKYAWKINPYECFFNQTRPDWNTILSNASKDVYYFSMAEVPSGMDVKKIQGFQYDRFLSNYSNVLEVRKINFKENPLFMVIFGSTRSKDEVVNILSLKIKDYVIS